ncbi:helix-turn-helix domain-containing protein [Paenibacillus sp. 1011MAR3C5]|uniref:helix-turn-helix domain-containing protein n=1 Tax=Paenibacillus sp. 1011MAR3C5 TaxID=1675787 RepID=UPI000E6D0825|nr:helix-turn-helix domain-containing protein [Paenibacillus sp. 1011MAR3C5]RJE86817.1 helix-turn-helix domain-containing protein [Paenibacillus sp. 1011MAR3C5]
MSELGALLRKARDEKGLSLDDIQELTKIRKRYLEAIESGDHSVLPGTFYVRAFVKNYSEAVGLDPDEVLRLYQHEVPAPAVEPSTEPIPVRKPRKVKSGASERLGKIGFNVVMWCFLILIVVVIWYFAFNKDNESPGKVDDTPITENSNPPEPTTNTSEPPVSPTPPPPTKAPTSVTFNSKVGNVDMYDIGPAGVNHKVELKVKGGRNWVGVQEGSKSGKKLYFTNVEDGEVLTFDLTTRLYINVGRADFTEIWIDGVLVPDGDRSSSKQLLINPLVEEGAQGEDGASGGDTEGGGEVPDSITGE